MPLIQCPDCGTDISDSAPSCVKCGRPMETRKPAVSPTPYVSSRSPDSSEPTVSIARILKALSVVAAVVATVILAGTYSRHQSRKWEPSPTQAPPTPDPHAIALERILLVDTKWKTGGFGTTALATFTVLNANPFPVKDLSFECAVYAKSGTPLDSLSHVIYEVVKPDEKRKLPEANLGFINSQGESLACRITGFADAK